MLEEIKYKNKPFILTEKADFYNCKQKVEKSSNTIVEKLNFIKNSKEIEQKEVKVIQNNNKVVIDTPSAPIELSENTVNNYLPTIYPTDSNNVEKPQNNRSATKRNSNFGNALIY